MIEMQVEVITNDDKVSEVYFETFEDEGDSDYNIERAVDMAYHDFIRDYGDKYDIRYFIVDGERIDV